MHDFEAIAVFQNCLGPRIARGDFAVEFDGDAVGLHVEGFDEGRKGELSGRRGIRKVRASPLICKFIPLIFSRRPESSLLGLAKGEFAGYGAAFMVGLDHDGRIRQGRLIDLDGDGGIAGGVGDGLGIKRRGVRASEAENQAGGGNGRSSFGDAELHGEFAIGVNRGGIFPLHVELFDAG